MDDDQEASPTMFLPITLGASSTVGIDVLSLVTDNVIMWSNLYSSISVTTTIGKKSGVPLGDNSELITVG